MQGQRNRGQNQQLQPIKLTSNDMFSSIPMFSGAVDDDITTFVDKFDEVTVSFLRRNSTPQMIRKPSTYLFALKTTHIAHSKICFHTFKETMIEPSRS